MLNLNKNVKNSQKKCINASITALVFSCLQFVIIRLSQDVRAGWNIKIFYLYYVGKYFAFVRWVCFIRIENCHKNLWHQYWPPRPNARPKRKLCDRLCKKKVGICYPFYKVWYIIGLWLQKRNNFLDVLVFDVRILFLRVLSQSTIFHVRGDNDVWRIKSSFHFSTSFSYIFSYIFLPSKK